MDKILRKPDVENLVGMTERSIREWEHAGRFPKRFRIDPRGRAVGWSAREVHAWMESRTASREIEHA